MNFKNVATIAIAFIGFIILVLLLTSPNGWVIGLVGIFCAVGIFLLNKHKEDEANPVLAWKKQVAKSCSVQTVKLGDLVTLGGYDFEGNVITSVHQETHFGRVLGFTQVIDNEAVSKKFKRVFFFTVKPRGIRGVFPFSLFVSPDIYSVFPHQLETKEFTMGMNICIKGATWRDVEGIFYLNDASISPDEVMTNLNSTITRITLGRFFAKLPKIIDNAVEANGSFKQDRGLKDNAI